MNHVWRRIGVLAGGALSLLLLAGCGTAPAARVNGETITNAEYQRDVQDLMQYLEQAQGIDWANDPRAQAELPRLRAAVMENMIQTRLIRQQAQQDGITVSDADIEARTAELRGAVGGRDALVRQLQTRDLTAQAFRQLVIDEIYRDRLMEKHVAPETGAIEERHVRHVLVDSREKAEAVRQRLAAGESWEQVAGEVSLDPGTRSRGGDLGFLQRGDTVPAFDEAAFALQPDELSQPVQTDFGFHVLQVTEARTRQATPDEVAGLQQRSFDAYLRGLRQSAQIENNVAE